MTFDREILALESEWSSDDGFFWQIRQGCFAPSAFQRALAVVSRIAVTEETTLPRRLISLLWYIPIVMQWQVERVRERQGDLSEYTRAIAVMTNEIERILGTP